MTTTATCAHSRRQQKTRDFGQAAQQLLAGHRMEGEGKNAGRTVAWPIEVAHIAHENPSEHGSCSRHDTCKQTQLVEETTSCLVLKQVCQLKSATASRT